MSQYNKALSYLEKSLSSGVWKAGDRLPGLRDIGKQAGVSEFTLRKAIKYLEQKGSFAAVERSGIWVLPLKIEKSNSLNIKTEKWQKIRTNIANDLLGRTLDATKPLPSIQELCHRYGTSYPIIKKALSSLEKEGVLKSHKRSYKPNLYLSSDSHTTKILVLAGFFPDKINKEAISLQDRGFNLTFRGLASLHKLEQLCTTQNFRADIWGYFFENGQITWLDPDLNFFHSTEKFKNYYGICLMKSFPILFSLDFSRMLSRLADLGIPISIFEETNEMGWSIPNTKKQTIRVFSIGATNLAAKKIGRFLLDLGHREIAFISAWHQEDTWPQKRYEGLCMAFAMAKGCYVHLFADYRFPPGDINLDDKNLEEKITSIPPFKKILQEKTPFSQKQVESIESNIDWIFNTSIYRQKLEIFLQPLFKQAILNKNITAWVCADDYMAFGALQFLRENHLKIPESISVVGFEDVPDAFNSGLTTYNYDAPGVMQTMVAYIFNPSLFPEKQGIFLEKNGFLVARQSSGPVRKETDG